MSSDLSVEEDALLRNSNHHLLKLELEGLHEHQQSPSEKEVVTFNLVIALFLHFSAHMKVAYQNKLKRMKYLQPS